MLSTFEENTDELASNVCGAGAAMPSRHRLGRGTVGTSRVRSTYTRNVASFVNRLACVAMAFALSGAPAVMACMALCLASPLSATSHAGSTPAHHEGHHGAAEPAAVSPHAHHGTAHASAVDAAAAASADGRLVGTCDGYCGGAPVELAAGPGVERTDAKALSVAQSIEVESLYVSVANRAAAPPSPPVQPPSPTSSPLALRI